MFATGLEGAFGLHGIYSGLFGLDGIYSGLFGLGAFGLVGTKVASRV